MKYRWNQPKPDWCDRETLERGRLPPRALVYTYGNVSQARRGLPVEGGRYLSLNGLWSFAYADCPGEADPRFMETDFDDGLWDRIAVPSEWEFSGYGRPHYTDSLAIFPVTDPPIPPAYNPTGSYRRRFTLPDDGLLTIIRFEGVESGFHLWVNGRPAGYSQGSRLVSEFDITPLTRPGENVLAVRVYKFTDGSYLENQDMWRLGGIMRDVCLIRRPESHIKDIQVKALLCEDGGGRLELRIDGVPSPGGRLRAELAREEKVWWQAEAEAAESRLFTAQLASVLPWSAELPHLYELTVFWDNREGPGEVVTLRIGFRRIEIIEGLLRINGAALKFRGVNYHLWSDTRGRGADPERIRQDLKLLKAHNVNALRTAHYPQAEVFYSLCDELGFYVMSEADLECCMCQLFGEPNLFADSPLWEEAFLDRIRRTVLPEINHPSVVLWSLGNESGYGRNFAAAAGLARRLDPTRPIHYEEDRDAVSADVYSSMYTNHEKLAELGKQRLPKPHILCEYAHTMGNGPGGLEAYEELFWAYPRLQGGFLWEWRDHTIRRRGPERNDQICYGGDFGDAPNNRDFCADGLTLGDGTLSPAMAQVKHAFSPIRAVGLDQKTARVQIWNRNDFRSADIYRMDWECTAGDKILSRGQQDLPAVKPGEKAWVPLGADLAGPAPSVVTLRFFPRQAGEEELDVCQFFLPQNEPPRNFPAPAKPGEVILEERQDALLLSTAGAVLRFSPVHGALEAYHIGERALITGRFDLCFYRAPIQNDRRQAPVWEEFMVPYLQPCLLEMETGEGLAGVRIKKRYAPYTMNWYIDAELTYRMAPDGSFTLQVRGEPQGRLPPTLPRIGLYGPLAAGLERVSWYGRGPGECYRDSKAGSPLGAYKTTVDALHFPYAVPQENGNRTDVAWVSFTGEDGAGLLAEAEDTLNFTAHHYTLDDLVRAQHDHELPRRDDIWLHLDHAHHGLGSAGWGPDALPQDSLNPQPFSFRWRFSPRRVRG
jgi:beta-galactosidase/evolved beta-galactosidase subunit alpha